MDVDVVDTLSPSSLSLSFSFHSTFRFSWASHPLAALWRSATAAVYIHHASIASPARKLWPSSLHWGHCYKYISCFRTMISSTSQREKKKKRADFAHSCYMRPIANDPRRNRSCRATVFSSSLFSVGKGMRERERKKKIMNNVAEREREAPPPIINKHLHIIIYKQQ